MRYQIAGQRIEVMDQVVLKWWGDEVEQPNLQKASTSEGGVLSPDTDVDSRELAKDSHGAVVATVLQAFATDV